MDFNLFSPVIAVLVYIPLVGLLVWLGKQLAGPEKKDAAKSSIYGSGEEAPTYLAAPGYRPAQRLLLELNSMGKKEQP